MYPASGPPPPDGGEDAPVRGQAGWGQGARGAAGYEDHGDSEVVTLPPGGEPAGARQGAVPRPGETQQRTCGEVMTKDPVCCLPGDTADKAAQLMMTEDIGPVLVIKNWQTKKLIGIVTDRDLAVKVVAEGRHPQQTTVEEVMTRDPVTCRPDETLQKAIEAMAEYQVRRIPVVDDNGQVVGIIAQADVATRVAAPQTTAEVVEEISKSGVDQ